MSPSSLLRMLLSLAAAHGALCVGAAAAAASPLVAVGADLAGSNFSYGISGLIPPDSDGAVGSDRLFEQVQRAYLVYDQTGAVPQRSSHRQFRSSAGITPNFLSDPRVLYDPVGGRWFAYGISLPSISAAASSMADPRQGWRAASIISDPDSSADFAGPDAYWDTAYFSGSNIGIAPPGNIDNGNVLAALLRSGSRGAAPSAVNAAVSRNIVQNQAGMELQPGGALQVPEEEPVFPALNAEDIGALQISPVGGPLASVTPAAAKPAVAASPGMDTNSATRQDATIGSNTGAASRKGGLPGVRAMASEDRSSWSRRFAVRDPLAAPAVPGGGIMQPANLDVGDGSAAVSPPGKGVIDSSGSRPSKGPGADAAAGMVAGDAPSFGDPLLPEAGVASYEPGANPAALDAPVAVPEPSPLLVLGTGFIGLLLLRRRGALPMRRAPGA